MYGSPESEAEFEEMLLKKGMAANISKVIGTTRQNIDKMIKSGNMVIIIVLITQPMNINNNAILSSAANILKITEMNKYTWLITAYLLCGKPRRYL